MGWDSLTGKVLLISPHLFILKHTVVWAIVDVQFSSVQSLSRVRLFATPWIAACQASLSITNSRSSLRLTSIESVMPSSHLILILKWQFHDFHNWTLLSGLVPLQGITLTPCSSCSIHPVSMLEKIENNGIPRQNSGEKTNSLEPKVFNKPLTHWGHQLPRENPVSQEQGEINEVSLLELKSYTFIPALDKSCSQEPSSCLRSSRFGGSSLQILL